VGEGVTERLSCIAPGCRRTHAREGRAAIWVWWVCPKHWALVPKRIKRVWARHQRQFRQYGFYPRGAQVDGVRRRIFREVGALPQKPGDNGHSI
jgi:hypothetical protein